MGPSDHVIVRIDLGVIRANAVAIKARTGVDLLAVVKADGYGHGIGPVTAALADLVDGFYVFDLAESIDARIGKTTGKPTIALRGQSLDAADWVAARTRPVVWELDRARKLKSADPVVSVDTGQQRFACPADHLRSVREAGDCREAMTHAVTTEQAARFDALTAGWPRRHAAGSALLDHAAARFDAVRPGLALYAGGARVTTPLVEVRDGRGPAGYSGFRLTRFGVILAGYSHGLRRGPCAVNGRPTRIVEVGMQSSFVELAPGDRRGDSVELLGLTADAAAIAAAWESSPQEVLVRLCGSGRRSYAE